MTSISAAWNLAAYIAPHIRPDERVAADPRNGFAYISYGGALHDPGAAVMRKLTSRPVGAPLTEELERGLFPWRFEERDDLLA